MKTNRLLLSLAAIILCTGHLSSQRPTNLNLNGSGEKYYNHKKASNSIQSSQIIYGGLTTYTAGSEIILQPGFEVKTGAEVRVNVDPDINKKITIMTYNVKQLQGNNVKHAEVIDARNPDIVALQEFWDNNLDNLKTNTGLSGEAYPIVTTISCGNALLWNPELGNPIDEEIGTKIFYQGFNTDIRNYIVVEFAEFCVAITHLSGRADKESWRRYLSNRIVNKDLTKKCMNLDKPIYIAGDLNTEPHNDGANTAMKVFKDAGFKVLNDVTRNSNGTYVQATTGDGKMIDQILEYNTNPNRALIKTGVPVYPDYPNEDYKFVISDHLPYVVTVKYK